MMKTSYTRDSKDLAGLSNDPKSSLATHPRPIFPVFRHEGFVLEVEEGQKFAEAIYFSPLRPHSNSGKPLPMWELHCRSLTGSLAGGCAIVLPPSRGDFPSPRQFPHPVLGEWISALRYTGLNWLECGPMGIAPGFSEESVITALWEALPRLMERNGVSFLIGTAATGSLALDTALRSGARVLEPFTAGALRYFLFVR
jgi:hypothetical protein